MKVVAHSSQATAQSPNLLSHNAAKSTILVAHRSRPLDVRFSKFLVTDLPWGHMVRFVKKFEKMRVYP